MRLIEIDSNNDSFDIWQQKTTLLGQYVGDLDLLETTNTDNIVSAINSVVKDDRRTLILSIAMS